MTNLETASTIDASSIDIPNGLNAVGYTHADVDDLVCGALPQERVIKLSPRPVGEADLRQLFLDSMTLW